MLNEISNNPQRNVGGKEPRVPGGASLLDVTSSGGARGVTRCDNWTSRCRASTAGLPYGPSCVSPRICCPELMCMCLIFSSQLHSSDVIHAHAAWYFPSMNLRISNESSVY